MNRTSIEWTDYTINPIRMVLPISGKSVTMCQRVSPGCQNCYAESISRRFWPKQDGAFPGYTAEGVATAPLVLDEAALQKVLKLRGKPMYWNKGRGQKPAGFDVAKVFWCDMTDIFQPGVTDEMLDRCFAVMALTPRLTHQVLTKRPERMLEYFTKEREHGNYTHDAAKTTAYHIWKEATIFQQRADGPIPGGAFEWGMSDEEPDKWLVSGMPLPNVWLGVSAENQEWANRRIPLLLRTPAAVRFVSAEPLLGVTWLAPHLYRYPNEDGSDYPGLNWVIVGGESGLKSKARPFQLRWARTIVEHCTGVGVACFVKQLGVRPYGEGGLLNLKDKKGGDMAEWPEDLRIRQFPA